MSETWILVTRKCSAFLQFCRLGSVPPAGRDTDTGRGKISAFQGMILATCSRERLVEVRTATRVQLHAVQTFRTTYFRLRSSLLAEGS